MIIKDKLLLAALRDCDEGPAKSNTIVDSLIQNIASHVAEHISKPVIIRDVFFGATETVGDAEMWFAVIVLDGYLAGHVTVTRGPQAIHADCPTMTVVCEQWPEASTEPGWHSPK